MNESMKHLKQSLCLYIIVAVALLMALPAGAQSRERRISLRTANREFFKTAEALRIGEQVLAYQRVTGGWPKNKDMVSEMSAEEMAKVLKGKERRDDSTIDNNATTMQMTFLARLYQATGDAKYRDAFRRGVEFLLSGQYDNGGWPQFWPNPKGYKVQITYNDGAISNTLGIIQKMLDNEKPYTGHLIDNTMRTRMRKSFDKGIECILRTQIVVDGEPTVWCQQHDRETLRPCKARAYELPSFCSQESARLVALLMSLPEPDERVKKAVRGAMRWFDKYKITGVRYHRGGFRGSGGGTRLIADAQALPIWARFYDLEHCEPYVCDRDGVPRKRLSEIGEERRNGYAWYGDRPRELYSMYDKWADKYDSDNKLNVSLNTKGANENGTFALYGIEEK